MYKLPPSPPFDWPRAIARNRDALSAILAALFVMLGFSAGARLERISHRFHRKVLRVLKPAESAVRRLIVIAARGLVAKPAASRAVKRGGIARKRGAGRRRPSFQLFDPRILPDCGPERTGPHPTPPLPSRDGDGLIDAKRLVRRLEAVQLALSDLPRQAKRLVRARARRDTIPRLQFLAPLRPGRPPGWRRKPTHEIDRVLKECHALACDVLWPNTS
jgi:hypothetical protein